MEFGMVDKKAGELDHFSVAWRAEATAASKAFSMVVPRDVQWVGKKVAQKAQLLVRKKDQQMVDS